MKGTVLRTVVDRMGAALGQVFPAESTVGRALRRAASRIGPMARPPGLEVLIDEFGAAFPEASFVQIGANDGVQFDPLRDQIVKRRWRGVLVEPVPAIFERLVKNHGGVERVRLANVAVAQTDEDRKLYYLPASSDPSLPDWYEAVASFRKDVLLQHKGDIPDIEERMATVTVRAVTFDTLCAEHRLATVDLVHTDVEGYDYEIIRTIDFARYRPRCVLFEHYHMDRSTYGNCVGLLRDAGFEDFAFGMDTACLNRALVGDKPNLLRTWDGLRRSEPLLAFRTEVDGQRSTT